MVAVGAVGTPVNAGDANGAFNNISAVLLVILVVFEVILVSKALSAFVALVISAVILDVFAAIALVLLVILEVLEVILVSSAFSAFVALVISAVILDVLAAIAFVFVVMLDVFDVIFVSKAFSAFVALVISAVILDVFAAMEVGKVAIVAELTPPTLFTVGKSAVPPKSFDNCNFPFTVVVASGVVELVILAATKAVVAT